MNKSSMRLGASVAMASVFALGALGLAGCAEQQATFKSGDIASAVVAEGAEAAVNIAVESSSIAAIEKAGADTDKTTGEVLAEGALKVAAQAEKAVEEMSK